LEGQVVSKEGVSEEGMLIDYSDVSRILMEQIHDPVDHAFILYEGDSEALAAFSAMGDDYKTLTVPFVPTAENLAKWAFVQVEPFIETSYGNELRLVAFHVRETPKSWASWAP
jgi:6-pyruvoyltetrahydropterin/6-carboxytetrahydropterin synthase